MVRTARKEGFQIEVGGKIKHIARLHILNGAIGSITRKVIRIESFLKIVIVIWRFQDAIADVRPEISREDTDGSQE